MLYRRGLLKTSKLHAPVISVGNITAGGTGKTPLVEWVARTLACEGRRVCILTRGYGRDSQTRVVVSDGQSIMANSSEAGDEPFQLASSLLGQAAVICDSNRLAAGEWATRELDSDVFVLDDGFQHQRLARNLNIVTIDATNAWGNGHLLPYGRLREPRPELSRANCIVITRTEQAGDLDSLKETVSRLSGGQPVFTSRMKVRELRQLKTLRTGTPVTARTIEQPALAFCGIGNPRSFIGLLKRENFTFVGAREFPDHHCYRQADIDSLTETAKRSGAKSLVTTAKDSVKIDSLNFGLPCYVIEIGIVIDDEDALRETIRLALQK